MIRILLKCLRQKLCRHEFIRLAVIIAFLVLLAACAPEGAESTDPSGTNQDSQTPTAMVASETAIPSATQTPTTNASATQAAQATTEQQAEEETAAAQATEVALQTATAQAEFNAVRYIEPLIADLEVKRYDHDYNFRTNDDGSATLSAQAEPWRTMGETGTQRWNVYDVATVNIDGTVGIRYTSGGQETVITVDRENFRWSDEYHDLVIYDENNTPLRVYLPEYGVWQSAEPTVGITGNIADCGRMPDIYSMSDAEREAYMNALTTREVAYFQEHLAGRTFNEPRSGSTWRIIQPPGIYIMEGSSQNTDVSAVSCIFIRMTHSGNNSGTGLFAVWGVPDENGTALHYGHDLSGIYNTINDEHDYLIETLNDYLYGTVRYVRWMAVGMIHHDYRDQVSQNHWGYTVIIIEINSNITTSGNYANDFALYSDRVYNIDSVGPLNTIIMPSFIVTSRFGD